jgi:hypothetical protein
MGHPTRGWAPARRFDGMGRPQVRVRARFSLGCAQRRHVWTTAQTEPVGVAGRSGSGFATECANSRPTEFVYWLALGQQESPRSDRELKAGRALVRGEAIE